MLLYENLFFFNVFCYFNPSHAYWNQRRLFSGNLPGMFFVRCIHTFHDFELSEQDKQVKLSGHERSLEALRRA